MNLRQDLEESRDFWRQSADHDKKQLGLSLTIGALGLICAGVTAVGIEVGIPVIEDVAGLATASSLLFVGAESALAEFRNYTQMVRNTIQQETELALLDEQTD